MAERPDVSQKPDQSYISAASRAEASGSGLNLLSETVKGGVHSLVINPYNSIVQLANSGSQAVFGHELGWKTTNALAADEKATGAQAVARSIGEAGGNIVQMLAMMKVLKAVPALAATTEAGAAATALNARSVSLMGGLGFAQGSLLTPLKEGESDWHRLAKGTSSALAFMSMEAATPLLSRGLSGLGMERAAGMTGTQASKLMLGGGIGAGVDVQSESLLTKGTTASVSDTLTATAGGVLGGGVFHYGGKAISGMRSAFGNLSADMRLAMGNDAPTAGLAERVAARDAAVPEVAPRDAAVPEVAPRGSAPDAAAQERLAQHPPAEPQQKWKQLELDLGPNAYSQKPEVPRKPLPWEDSPDPGESGYYKALRDLVQAKDEAFSLAEQARAHRLKGDGMQAEALAEAALKKAGIDPAAPRESLEKISVPYKAWLDLDLELKATRTALNVAEVAYGKDSPQFLQLMESMSRSSTAGTSDTGLWVLGKLLKAQRAQFGADHQFTGDTIEAIAKNHKYHGRYRQAVEAFGRAATVRENTFGPNSPELADALIEMGNSAQHGARPAIAADAYARALAIKDARGETALEDRVPLINGLADALIESGRKTEAYAVLKQALPALDDRYFDRDQKHTMLQSLGRLYLDANRIEEGIALYNHSRYKMDMPAKVKPLDEPPPVADHRFNDKITRTSNPYLTLFTELQSRRMDEMHGLRWGIVNKYAWWVPNEEALKEIGRHGKILTLGAGTGYDVALLRARGVDVVAVDQHPTETGRSFYHRGSRSWTPIVEGTESVVPQYPDRTLMMAWPPEKNRFTGKPDAMAFNALRNYNGNSLIYIGDTEVTGDKRFHNLLEREWTLGKYVDIPQWNDIRDYLHVYHRRQGRLF